MNMVDTELLDGITNKFENGVDETLLAFGASVDSRINPTNGGGSVAGEAGELAGSVVSSGSNVGRAVANAATSTIGGDLANATVNSGSGRVSTTANMAGNVTGSTMAGSSDRNMESSASKLGNGTGRGDRGWMHRGGFGGKSNSQSNGMWSHNFGNMTAAVAKRIISAMNKNVSNSAVNTGSGIANTAVNTAENVTGSTGTGMWGRKTGRFGGTMESSTSASGNGTGCGEKKLKNGGNFGGRGRGAWNGRGSHQGGKPTEDNKSGSNVTDPVKSRPESFSGRNRMGDGNKKW
ncbi:hypothetical protein FQA39_LY16326 [Lamprigera yunnana]|nr:hypothetical protein FQA39_LY16326 [Lamprigera yunnana]